MFHVEHNVWYLLGTKFCEMLNTVSLIVDLTGFEPVTFPMPWERSTKWAKGPCGSMVYTLFGNIYQLALFYIS